MTDQVAEPRRDEERTSSTRWSAVVPGVIAAIFAGVVVAVSVGSGQKFIAGSENNAVLSDRVQLLLDQNKDQQQKLDALLARTGNLYTREEARADREAAERRFQSLETRLADISRETTSLSRRIDVLESTNTFIRQFVIERAPGPAQGRQRQ